jgi:hypothetical protein
MIRLSERVARLLGTRFGIVLAAAPAFAVLFFIHRTNSLAALHRGEVPPDLGYSAGTRVPLQLLQILCFAWLFAVYGLTVSRWRRLTLSARHVAWTAAAFALMAWILLPANSSDVLEYIGFGRLAAVYHVNPYLHTYSEFTDQFSTLITWDEPMPYGPVTMPIFAIGGFASHYGLFAAIYTLKFLWLLIYFADAYLIYVIAGSFDFDPAFAVAVFALNPLVVLEQAGNGHNDGLLVLFGLLAVRALQRGRDRSAVALALMATLVKMPGVLWLVGVIVVLVRRRRWRVLAEALVAGAGAAILILWVLPGSVAALTVLNSQFQYSEDSLHTLIIDLARGFATMTRRSLEYEDAFRVDRLVGSAVFVAICAWRYSRITSTETLLRELGRVMLVLLLGYAASVYPWYASWVIPMAALTNSGPLRRGVLIASASMVALYAVPYGWAEQAREHALWSALRLMAAFLIPLAWWVWSEIRALPAREPELERSPVAI